MVIMKLGEKVSTCHNITIIFFFGRSLHVPVFLVLETLWTSTPVFEEIDDHQLYLLYNLDSDKSAEAWKKESQSEKQISNKKLINYFSSHWNSSTWKYSITKKYSYFQRENTQVGEFSIR